MRIAVMLVVSLLIAGTAYAGPHRHRSGGYVRHSGYGTTVVRSAHIGPKLNYTGPRMNYSGPAYVKTRMYYGTRYPAYRYYRGVAVYPGYYMNNASSVTYDTAAPYTPANGSSYNDYYFDDAIHNFNDKEYEEIKPPQGISKQKSKDGSIRFSNVD